MRAGGIADAREDAARTARAREDARGATIAPAVVERAAMDGVSFECPNRQRGTRRSEERDKNASLIGWYFPTQRANEQTVGGAVEKNGFP